jgi:hypothetical protein
MNKITSLWIEAEMWALGYDPLDCSSSVNFTLDDETIWSALFVTYQNVETLRKKNEKTGECLHGGYFRAADMILIDSLTRERVQEVLEDIIAMGDLSISCSPCPALESE